MSIHVIFGGSFDPIHNGHLQVAKAVHIQLQADYIYFLPCKQSVLKSTTHASINARQYMISLSIAPYPWCKLDLREIQRIGPSYMVDTLLDLRQNLSTNTALILTIGKDAFLSLPKWYCYEQILKLCHILVIHRPNIENIIDNNLQKLHQMHATKNLEVLRTTPYGAIYYLNAGTYPISSTQIRQAIILGQDVSSFIPAAVLQYIKENQLYL